MNIFHRLQKSVIYRIKRTFLIALAYVGWIKLLTIRPKLIKYFPNWIISTIKPGIPTLPWLTYEAIDWLDAHLKKTMTVFEYNCGGSTMFIGRRVQEIHSVEHNRHWYDIIQSEIQKAQQHNVHLFHIPPTKITEDIDRVYRSSSEEYINQSFRHYIEKLKDFPDNYFDLISVDGRARNGCLKLAAQKTKPGGVVILDNSERKEYNPGKQHFTNWEIRIFRGLGPCLYHEWESTIWTKPLISNK